MTSNASSTRRRHGLWKRATEENAIDEKQQVLSFEDKEKNINRDHEAYLDDMHVIDQKLTHPDYDDEDDDVGGTLVGVVGNK